MNQKIIVAANHPLVREAIGNLEEQGGIAPGSRFKLGFTNVIVSGCDLSGGEETVRELAMQRLKAVATNNHHGRFLSVTIIPEVGGELLLRRPKSSEESKAIFSRIGEKSLRIFVAACSQGFGSSEIAVEIVQATTRSFTGGESDAFMDEAGYSRESRAYGPSYNPFSVRILTLVPDGMKPAVKDDIMKAIGTVISAAMKSRVGQEILTA